VKKNGHPWALGSIGQREITREQLAYLAGLVDGDGSINIKTIRGNQYAHVMVFNNQASVMEWLVQVFGGIWVHHQPKKYIHPGAKTTHSPVSGNSWEMNKQADVEWLLRHLMPFLVIKRERALQALGCVRKRLAL
jgi:hypothetical protein